MRRACDDAPPSGPVRLCDAPYLLHVHVSQVLSETIEAQGHAFLHPRLERRVASLLRRVKDRVRDRRLAILFGEGQRVKRFRPVATPGLGGDEPLGRHDLLIHPAHLHLGAVGMAPAEVPRPARSEIDFADGHSPAARSEHPVREVLGVGPSFEDRACAARRRRA